MSPYRDSNRCLKSISCGGDSIYAMDCSRSLLAVGGSGMSGYVGSIISDRVIRLIDTRTDNVIGELHGHEDVVRTLLLAPGEKRVCMFVDCGNG